MKVSQITKRLMSGPSLWLRSRRTRRGMATSRGLTNAASKITCTSQARSKRSSGMKPAAEMTEPPQGSKGSRVSSRQTRLWPTGPSGFCQLIIVSCLTGQRLEWMRNQPTAKRWGPYKTQTRDHVFKNCPRWTPQQKFLWEDVRMGYAFMGWKNVPRHRSFPLSIIVDS
jgi:hypothetical protein